MKMNFSKVKSYFILFFLLSQLSSLSLYAQTEPMYSQYMHNQLSINPAYAGNRESLQMIFFQRRQWVGMDGAPQTSSISINQSINDNKIGWGVQLYDDRLGVEKASGANFMLSTKVKISDEGYLSGGLSAGLMNYSIGLTSITDRFTPSDPSFYANLNKWLPNLGLGLFYNTDKFYAGVSIPNVIKSKLSTFDLIRSGLQKTNQYHVFITSGYVFDLNEDIKIKPSAMLKMISGAPAQLDINTNVLLQNKLGLGLSYRTNDAIVSMVELQASERIKIGYAYDLSISANKYYNNGSHELMLSYEISDVKAKVKSTRYF